MKNNRTALVGLRDSCSPKDSMAHKLRYVYDVHAVIRNMESAGRVGQSASWQLGREGWHVDKILDLEGPLIDLPEVVA